MMICEVTASVPYLPYDSLTEPTTVHSKVTVVYPTTFFARIKGCSYALYTAAMVWSILPIVIEIVTLSPTAK